MDDPHALAVGEGVGDLPHESEGGGFVYTPLAPDERGERLAVDVFHAKVVAVAPGADAVGPAEAHARQAAITKDLGIDLLVLPDVTDYRFTKESKSQSFYIGSKTWTETTYWAGVALRIVKPADGRVVYFARGEANSKEGYAPAVQEATDKAMAPLAKLLADYKAAQAAKR